MQQTKSFLLSLLFFIVFSILGIAVGFGIGQIVITFNNEGLFTSWKRLDGSLKFEQIADATSQMVWAKAANEKLYSQDSNCYRNANSCNQWAETSEIPNDIHNVPEQPMIKNGSCPIHNFRFFRKPPGNLVECAQTQFLGFDSGTVVYYALLRDGTIWTWRFSGSTIVDIFLTVLFSLVGLVLSIIIFVVFMIRRRRNKSETTTESNL